MSRQFTIITKDGSKWLRPVNPFDPRDIMWQEFNLKEPDLLYLGNHPEGTVLSEEQVTLVTQARHKDYTGSDWFNVYDNGNWDYYQTRVAYTDAESHDRQISEDYPGIDYQPLFDHMSKVYGLTLTTSEMDEIIGLSTYILAKK